MIVAHRSSRRGFTLFEMVLVIASVAAILALSGGLLHLMLGLDRSGRTHISDASAMARLSRQFRDDVRAARNAEAGVSARTKMPRLSLSIPGGPTVTYEAEDDTLLRIEAVGEKVIRREAFPMKRVGPVAFETDGAFIRLVLSRRPAESAGSSRQALRIEARLGKHRELARLTEARQ